MFHLVNKKVIKKEKELVRMKVSKAVKTAIKFAPIVIPIIKKVVEAKKSKTPTSPNPYHKR